MGVEVVESNSAVNMENGNEASTSVENGKVIINFGSHGVEEPVKGEAPKVFESSAPKDAVDEWPEPKQVHSFYFVRYRAFEDPNLKNKLDLADKELQKRNQDRFQLIERLKEKRGDRAQIIAQLRSLGVENKQFRIFMDEKRKEMEPLQQALGKLRGPAGSRERASGICSSEEELNDLIKSFQYRIQHESIPLSEEKQILREIKQLEGTREKVIANSAERARIQDSLGEKEAIQDQVKLIGVDLDGVRKEKQVISAKLKQLDDAKLEAEKVIKALEEELTTITEKRDKTFENIKEMRKQRDEGNSPYHQNRVVLTKAKVLAVNKDVEALKDLSDSEVENFMNLWNNNKAFRDDYERRILSSLDARQLSRDGRMRNSEEKPLVSVEVPTPSVPEVVKTTFKQPPKQNLVSAAKEDASEWKDQNPKNAKSNKGNNKTELTLEKIEEQDREEVFQSDKIQKDSLPRKEELDETKLKELKKAEEMAKRIQTEERRKKLAEKAAAKAAKKAEQEAEKKLKEIISFLRTLFPTNKFSSFDTEVILFEFIQEREKRARKKTGTTAAAVDSEEPSETNEEVVEQEMVEEKFETTVPLKNKARKENPIRHRARPRGGLDSLPKAMLKRKKTTDYWMWTISAALVVLALMVVGYIYLS
ncbi:proton pump-interactor 1-like [Primulina huaijiensis]|uniref:proton pump-interactor 1-like n=1 Tax=Primulina huaijiensis TaxID=1492673 RepID=UPI003CC6FF4C